MTALEWYRREVANLTELDRARIRGIWLTLPFAYLIVRYIVFQLI
jgi:hypothetical protein